MISESNLNFRFTKQSRLLKSVDYSVIFEKNKKFTFRAKGLLVLAITNNLENSRIGIIVPKKNVGLAVIRNRYKRLSRETFRCLQHQLQTTSGTKLDFIVLVQSTSEKGEKVKQRGKSYIIKSSEEFTSNLVKAFKKACRFYQ